MVMRNLTIAEQNDALRASIPAVLKPNALVVTHGIMVLGPETVAAVLMQVKSFTDFDRDKDDPYGEHDFGRFTHNGTRVIWKIDDHGGNDGLGLVLTVMLAEEY